MLFSLFQVNEWTLLLDKLSCSSWLVEIFLTLLLNPWFILRG